MKNIITHIIQVFLLVVFFLVTAISGTKAQTTDYKFQSMFIINFTKYIDWPDHYKDGNFVIGVVGSKSVAGDLSQMVNDRKVGYQKVVVERYSTLAEVSRCHVLFLTEGSLLRFESVLEKLKGQPTLIVTEKEGLIQKGSYINLVSIGGKMKFEINEPEIEKAGLKVSKTLVGLAIKH